MSWIWSAIVNAAIWIGGKLMAMGVSQNIAVAIGYVIVGTAAIGGAKWLGGRLIDVPDIGLGQQGATILANAPSNTAPIPVIYGARRVVELGSLSELQMLMTMMEIFFQQILF